MRRVLIYTCMAFVFLFAQMEAQAQQPEAASSNPTKASVASVPRLIQFNGAVKDRNGEPLGGVAARLTFSVYEESQGGAALWTEWQVLQLDEQGRYTVLLGATASEGVPVELFPGGKARWLGVQVENRDEDPRVLMVSVPYALKAEDAEKLGGKRASDFVLAEQLNEKVRTAVAVLMPAGSAAAPTGKALAAAPAAAGGPAPKTQPATNFVDSNTTQVVSVQQNDGGDALRAVTVSTTAGKAALRGEATSTTSNQTIGVAGTSAAANGVGVQGEATATTGGNVGVKGTAYGDNGVGVRGLGAAPNGVGVMGETRGDAGIGVYGAVWSAGATAGVFNNHVGGKILSGVTGTSSYTEVFRVDGSGNVTATAFIGNGSGLTGIPSSAGGTVTSVGSGTGLTGGPITSSGALSLDTGFTDARYTQIGHTHTVGDVPGAATLAGNIFLGNQNVEGSVSVSGAVGAGAGIFNGNAADALVRVTQSGAGGGVLATTQGTTYNAAAVWGIAYGTTGATNGVHGSTLSPEGAGVWGDAGSSTGNTTGVTGITVSDQGTGVWGQAKAETGSTVGVHGSSWSDLGTGVRGDGPLYGVYGQATASNGNGVQGVGTAVGVFGIATAEDRPNIGVVGWSKNHSGIGVSGQVLFEDGASKGVWDVVQSPDGIAGVFDNESGGKLLSGQVRAVEKFSVNGNGDVVTTTGDFQALGAGKGIILTSPDGSTCARISIDNEGALVTAAFPCAQPAP